MKIVTIRFKKGIRRKIKDTQKTYDYMCPINNIAEGEYVLLEVVIGKRGRKHGYFQVGRIEKVFDPDNYSKSPLPYGFVICKIPVEDFDKRCSTVTRMKKKHMQKIKNRTKQ